MNVRGVLVSKPGIRNVQQLKRYVKSKANDGSKVVRYSLSFQEFDPLVKVNRWALIWGLGRFGGRIFLEEVTSILQASGYSQSVIAVSDIVKDPASVKSNPQKGAMGTEEEDELSEEEQREEERKAEEEKKKESEVIGSKGDVYDDVFMAAQSASAYEKGIFSGEYDPGD